MMPFCVLAEFIVAEKKIRIKRLTAMNPLMRFMAVPFTSALPDEYSNPHSAQATTKPTAYKIQARYEKNRTMLCTQLISNISAPMLPISAKKFARKPMICL